MATQTHRRERERAARRRVLLAAAERLFQRHGYRGATMAALAREAELPLATIYALFPSKERIYFTLIEERAAELFAAIQEAAAAAEPGLARLLAVVRRVVAYFEARRAFFQIYISTRSGLEWTVKDDLGEEVNRIYNRHLDLLEGIVAEAIARGELRQLPPKEVAHGIAGLVNAFLFQWVVGRSERPLSEQLPVLEEMLLHGVAP
ncbi:MAG: TetR/AcrR family transcriptional regulator [Nitrospirae bacterium]|nr:MAG: TetR/AcrR family transcriptional regulator [Nitrospirota bacterium]